MFTPDQRIAVIRALAVRIVECENRINGSRTPLATEYWKEQRNDAISARDVMIGA